MKNDPLFYFSTKYRCLIRSAFIRKSYKKDTYSHILLGCDFNIAYSHITKNGKISIHGMQIDHIIPLSWAQTKEELKALCHYKNLQLLTRSENMSKGNKPPSIDLIDENLPKLAKEVFFRNFNK